MRLLVNRRATPASRGRKPRMKVSLAALCIRMENDRFWHRLVDRMLVSLAAPSIRGLTPPARPSLKGPPMTLPNILRRPLAALLPIATVLAVGLLGPARGDDIDPRLKKDEEDRVALIEKIKKSVVAVLAPGGQGGGSGVLISEDGYALTNFHVVAARPRLDSVRPADGDLYDAVLVGLDKVGDVALIKLLPEKGSGREVPLRQHGRQRQGPRRRLVAGHGQSVPAGHRLHADRDLRPGQRRPPLPVTRPARCWNTPTASRSTRRSIPATPAARCSTWRAS